MASNGLVPGARLPVSRAFGDCNRIDLPSFKAALMRDSVFRQRSRSFAAVSAFTLAPIQARPM